MILRWVLFAWAVIASTIMLIISLAALFSGNPISGDNSIVFGLISLVGLPAWLILVALSIYNWRATKQSILVIHLSPVFVAVLTYVLVVMP
jgi:hypothetical protein